ncbi:MAG: hypothetical protein HXX09_17170, partial [Bacteroidetes bacterium]|nr:hypothetical protein [Bacteroidota bacterium]
MKKITLFFLFIFIGVNSYSQFQWRQVNGPNGANVNCIGVNSNGDIFEGN